MPSTTREGTRESHAEQLLAVPRKAWLAPRKIVDHGTDELQEHNKQDPNHLVITFVRFVHAAVHQHPDPKRRTGDPQENEKTDAQEVKDDESTENGGSSSIPAGCLCQRFHSILPQLVEFTLSSATV